MKKKKQQKINYKELARDFSGLVKLIKELMSLNKDGTKLFKDSK